MDGRAVFLIAPPAGGKGTQAKALEATGFYRVEMSTVLKLHAPRTAKTIGGSSLVDSTTVIEALKDHIEPIPQGQDLVIDGFPRTQAQARFAVSYFGHRHVAFVLIEVDDETCEDRAAGRLREDMRKYQEGCGGEPRTSDEPQIHRERLMIYRREMVELEDYLNHHVYDKIYRVSGDLPPKDISKIIRDVLGPHTALIS